MNTITGHPITGRFLVIEFSDRTLWAVPVEVIARNRAENYKSESRGDVERSLAEDTNRCFEHNSEVYEWASNNMNWSDMSSRAIQLEVPAIDVDYQVEWGNAKKKVYTFK